MMNVVYVFIIATFIAVTGRVSAAATCEKGTLSQGKVLDLQARLFDALGHEDRAVWDSLVTPDFIAFERGKQYASTDFFGLLETVHRHGVHLVWSVTEPRVEIDNKLAVMAYVNVGSIAEHGAAPTPQRWLETVVFRRDGLCWRAVMVTSMRVDPSA